MNKTITVRDKMQQGYRYQLTARPGKDFDPGFRPDLTPAQMLRMGVFGGVYLRDCKKEFPAAWFVRARLASGPRDASLNYFKVLASQSLAQWRRKGWIYRDDPRGWFQWYCRYFMGRRIPVEDARQIKRWHMMRRHAAQIAGACRAGDVYCRPRQRQALLQWAYNGATL